MKRVFTLLASIALALASLFVMPSAARAEPTGQYYYACLYSNGYVYWLKPGEKTTQCHGVADILVYINGQHVRTVPVSGPNIPDTKPLTEAQGKKVLKAGGCAIAIITDGVLIATTKSLATLKVVDATLAALGTAFSCA